MSYRDKLLSLQFPKVKSVPVRSKDTGEVVGEQHYHTNGTVGATIEAGVTRVGTQAHPIG